MLLRIHSWLKGKNLQNTMLVFYPTISSFPVGVNWRQSFPPPPGTFSKVWRLAVTTAGWGHASGISWAETRDTAKSPTGHRRSSRIKTYPGLSVSSSRMEKHCFSFQLENWFILNLGFTAMWIWICDYPFLGTVFVFGLNQNQRHACGCSFLIPWSRVSFTFSHLKNYCPFSRW